MKTKRRSETGPTVNLVGCDPLLCEKIRASLARSPLHFSSGAEPLPPDEVDLFVAPAGRVEDLVSTGVPVIAHGPAGLLRAAYLAGCVDFLREPWTPEELALRAQAALARVPRRFQFPWGTVAFEGDALRVPGGTAVLTHHEALILRALLRARGRPVPREALTLALRGSPTPPDSRRIDVHVSGVRRKVRALVAAADRFVICVRGQGYMVP